jgi:hypothetical protein
LSEDAKILADGYDKNIAEELREKGVKKVKGLGNYRLFECPLSFITSDTWDITQLVYLIESSGHLLHSGGWGNQPFWLVEAYRLFKRERAKDGNTGTENNNNG